MRLKRYINEIKWSDIVKPKEPVIYKGIPVTKEPQVKVFPVEQIKKVMDKVPLGNTKEIRVLNTPYVKGREYGMHKNGLVMIAQKGATKKTLNYTLAHELGHANGLKTEKEAHDFALKYGYEKKFNI